MDKVSQATGYLIAVALSLILYGFIFLLVKGCVG